MNFLSYTKWSIAFDIPLFPLTVRRQPNLLDIHGDATDVSRRTLQHNRLRNVVQHDQLFCFSSLCVENIVGERPCLTLVGTRFTTHTNIRELLKEYPNTKLVDFPFSPPKHVSTKLWGLAMSILQFQYKYPPNNTIIYTIKLFIVAN